MLEEVVDGSEVLVTQKFLLGKNLFARFVAAMRGRFDTAVGEVASVDGRVAARAEVMLVSFWLIDGPRLCPLRRSVR